MTESPNVRALKAAGLPMDIFADRVLAGLDNLSPDEVQSLVEIHQKISADLPDDVAAAADSVGVLVW